MKTVDFIRHGDHKPIGDKPLHCGLNERGCDEARSLHKKLGIGHEIRSYSVNNQRSIGTIALALNPETDNPEVEESARVLIETQMIRVANNLDYARQERSSYRSELDEAFFTSKALRFFVNKSDTFQKDGFSTYSSMAAVVGKYVANSNADTNTVVLAREFFYPSFRAKLIELKDGVARRDYYADWYGDNVEWNPEARQRVDKIAYSPDKNFILRDEYGELEFAMNDLRKIIGGVNND